MSALSKVLIGGAGIAALAGAAAPAAAQYYPNPYGYGNNGGGVVGAIINAIGGYGQYPYGNYGYGQTSSQAAVNQCSRAVEARLGGGYGYGNQGYGYAQPYGYGQPYGYANQGYGGARIAGITRIERRSNGGLRVYGVAMSNNQYGQYGAYGYGNQPYGNQPYGYQNAQRPDLRFNCKIDRYGRVTDVDVNRVAYNQNDYYYGYRRY
jgi:hypothetical protein